LAFVIRRERSVTLEPQFGLHHAAPAGGAGRDAVKKSPSSSGSPRDEAGLSGGINWPYGEAFSFGFSWPAQLFFSAPAQAFPPVRLSLGVESVEKLHALVGFTHIWYAGRLR